MQLINYTNQEYYEEGIGAGKYQVLTLKEIIEQFMVIYVGEDKIIPKAKRLDVAFHAQRALAELSFDTLRSCRSYEAILPSSLQLLVPIDYVNYTQVSWVDSKGIKHRIYPESKTSNSSKADYVNADDKHMLSMDATLTDNSNVFVLDGDYSDQLVHGMRFETHPYIKQQSYIHGISTTDGITSVTIKNALGTNDRKADIPGGGSATVELVIQRFNIVGLDRPVKNNTLIETTIKTATAASQDATNLNTMIIVNDTTGIEEGMFVNHHSIVNKVSGNNTAVRVVSVGTNHLQISDGVGLHNNVGTTAGEAISFMKFNKDSVTVDRYKSATPSENTNNDYDVDTYWPIDGSRYGLDPQRSNINGSFYDACNGKLYFSSNLAGKVIVVDYISDRLGNEGRMIVHKFAEEAIYKWVLYAILSTRANTPEYQVARLKKERFAEVRKAKLRLSNIKIEEITQILRGKSKQIKH